MSPRSASPPSSWHRWKRRLQNRFRSRILADYEWRYTYDLDVPEIVVHFYVERRPLRFNVYFPGLTEIRLAGLKMQVGDDLVPAGCAAEREEVQNGVGVEVVPDAVLPVTKAVLTFEKPEGSPDAPSVRVLATQDEPQDLSSLKGAFRCYDQQDMTESALEYLDDYEAVTDVNPQAAHLRSELYLRLDRREDAENAALRALVNLPSDWYANYYREIRKQRPPTPIEKVRKLQEDASGWVLEPHHGLVVLERESLFRLGLNGWHRKTGKELVEVRRQAAGRFLKSLGFAFSSGEFILHTDIRVIHGDGEVETVNDENFTVTDSSEKNVFITVEDEKSGIWILPDLAPGDVVEFGYELICRNNDPEGDDEFFILSSLFDANLPTYRGYSEFLSPLSLPLRFACRNCDMEPRRETPENKDHVLYSFEGTRHIPGKNTNFPYENKYLNPFIACSRDDTTWSHVSRKALTVNFGDEEGGDAGNGNAGRGDASGPAPEELPAPLQAEVGDAAGTEALERAFYWIRDKLKYASLRSGLEHIGRTTRAARIVESGTGDCKDKSFLLAMICRKFGIPYEYVMISTKNGLLIEELPAQQFDHVFLRARGGGEERWRKAAGDGWLYLDAANSMAPFGSPPAWCQGIQAMIVDDAGTVVTVPVDAPAANRIAVVETFDSASDGWLQGTFDFRARGHSGRLANERAKGLSLFMGDPQQAIQEGLAPYFSFLVVQDHTRVSDTGNSGLFHVTGRHRRSPLVILGRNRRRVGRLAWGVPALPLGYWRNLPMDRLFVMDYPLQVRLRITLQGALRRSLDDVSRIDHVENDLCRITETVTEGPDAVTISREMTFRKRMVQGPALAQVPASMEALEKALHLVISLNEEEQP